MTNRSLALLGAVLIVGCADRSSRFVLDEVEFSTPPASGEPNLHATPDGRVLLSWFEPRGPGRSDLRMAVRADGEWSAPIDVAADREFFVNWADFPSVVEQHDGTWVVHWLEKVATSTYAYHVMLSRSTDGGSTWSEPIRAHRDESPTEHGFVSMVPDPRGGVAYVFLDGQNTGGHDGHGGAMSLRFRTADAAGMLGEEQLIDNRICDCCQTSMVWAGDVLVAAYRDRSEEEVRDIAISRRIDGAWTEPYHVGNDNWVFPACPVNGPALAADDNDVAVAWYSAANQEPHVSVAFSHDAGARFGDPLRVDGGQPIGRVDLVMRDDGSVVVVWLERVGSDQGAIRARRVHPDGSMDEAWDVAPTSPTRRSGFPHLAPVGDDLIVAWTEVGDEGGVRAALIRAGG